MSHPENTHLPNKSVYPSLIDSVCAVELSHNSTDILLKHYTSERLRHDLRIASFVLDERKIADACALGRVQAKKLQITSVPQPCIAEILDINPSLGKEETAFKLLVLGFVAFELRTNSRHFLTFCAFTAQALLNSISLSEKRNHQNLTVLAQTKAKSIVAPLRYYESDTKLTKARKTVQIFPLIYKITQVENLLKGIEIH